MRGRHVFMDSLSAHGVRYIFGNPGTTENPLIGTLSDYPDLQYILTLHEGIAIGAASYYAQASGNTGLVNLHAAPGLGNGLGMLYGALKANSPVIVTAGQQDTRMRLREPLLSHDLVAMAAPLTKWSTQVERVDEIADIMRRAFKIAHDPPAGPVFVALPIDVMERETDVGAANAGDLFRAASADPAGISAVVDRLLASNKPVVVAGDDVARSGANDDLVRLAEAVGASVWFEGLHQRIAFPTGHPNARGGLPFDAARIAAALRGADLVVMVGGPFFEEVWYSDGSPFPAGARVVQIEESTARLAFNHPVAAGLVGHLPSTLAAIDQNLRQRASAAFASAAGERNTELQQKKADAASFQKLRVEQAWNREPPSLPRVVEEIRRGLPPNTIVVDESITASSDLGRTIQFETADDYFGGRGGGIGQGLAGAIGVKLGHPDRPQIAISGDGSAMYSIQALWTAAHHDLAIVFAILANREYRVLKHNMDIYRQRFDVPSNEGYPQMDLHEPVLGFVELAAGMGIAGTRVAESDEISAAIKSAFDSGKPHLVEIVMEGKA